MSDNQQAVVEAAPETKVVGKKGKVTATGNLIADIAAEVEKLTKGKALSLADELANEVEVNYFKLGGVLNVIRENTWFEGYTTFEDYVSEHFGYADRTARYLIKIYQALVSKMIPWEKVSSLGWTKLKDLADILTLENVDEWVAKAGPLTVKELQALLKQQGAGEGAEPVTTTSTFTTLKFKVANDQAEVINSALSKAKAENGTEFDNVALERICGGYLAGNNALEAEPQKSLKDQLAAAGIASEGLTLALNALVEAFPSLDIVAEETDSGAINIVVKEQTTATA
jgi:hypothetical protein